MKYTLELEMEMKPYHNMLCEICPLCVFVYPDLICTAQDIATRTSKPTETALFNGRGELIVNCPLKWEVK